MEPLENDICCLLISRANGIASINIPYVFGLMPDFIFSTELGFLLLPVFVYGTPCRSGENEAFKSCRAFASKV